MSPSNPEWPELLRSYEAAIAEFDRVSRALTTVLTGRTVDDDDFRELVAAEERARETVVLARMRIMNLWRESEAEARAQGADASRASARSEPGPPHRD